MCGFASWYRSWYMTCRTYVFSLCSLSHAYWHTCRLTQLLSKMSLLMQSCETIYSNLIHGFPSCNSYQKTIHQFYLQLREDVLSGQLYCHEEASFILGGLSLQAETSDYNDTLGDEYFLPEHYIPSRVCILYTLHVKDLFECCDRKLAAWLPRGCWWLQSWTKLVETKEYHALFCKSLK